MPSRDHFVARMREQLRLSDPDLDTSIGTIPRKMIDAVAEMLAEKDPELKEQYGF